MKQAMNKMRGDGLRARAVRSIVLVLGGTFGTNLLRLGSNLILTRLLFPEAFGLMALVQVFLSGLQMFSDLGIRASIIQNERQDASFINTAWTLQIMRGGVLWLIACAIALPAAQFYNEPMLATLMPVVGFSAAINGFRTTNIHSHNRDLKIGAQITINLSSQCVSIVVMLIAAWMYQSVWALVAGNLVGALYGTLAGHWLIDGIKNRVHLERKALRELFNFGQFIFMSTIASFLLVHADKAILGKFASLSALAAYNIGFPLAALPSQLATQIVYKVVFPLFSAKRPSADGGNKLKINEARRLMNAGVFVLSALVALFGDVLIRFLYDERYHLAGPILIFLSISLIPVSITSSYSTVLLAEGNSKHFAALNIVNALVKTALMIIGLSYFGLVSITVAGGLAALLTYPLLVRYLRQYDAWDPLSDMVFLALTALLAVATYLLNQEVIDAFLQGSMVVSTGAETGAAIGAAVEM